MAVQMPSPWKHPKTGMYYIRVAIPADLVAVYGKNPFKRTLGTKDLSKAKALFVESHAALLKKWDAVRAGPQPLSHKRRVALSGTRYKDNVALLGNNPETVTIWQRVIRRCDLAGETPDGLENTFGAILDKMLEREALFIDPPSRALLLQDVCTADRQAAEYLLRNARGDYGPDPIAQRFPDWDSVKPIVEAAPVEPVVEVTLTSLFGLWKQDHLANGNPLRTVSDFEHKIANLIAFLGHQDAQKVTPRNIVDWTEHLRHEKGLHPKTVGDKYLCAVRAIYRLAVAKIILSEDPTARVKISIPKPQKTRPSGFTDAEAVQILTSTMAMPETFGRKAEHNMLACKWVPWICAYTGARGGEITQLRREDLMEEQGIACIRITPEAGSVKTNAYRMVPLHRHLIDLGLVAFIRSRPDGPLFHPATATARSNGMLPAARVLGKVSEWVRSVAGITDPKVKPNHGWRHRFKTVGREHDIALEYLDALQGHSDRRASSDYGEMPMKAMYREIQSNHPA